MGDSMIGLCFKFYQEHSFFIVAEIRDSAFQLHFFLHLLKFFTFKDLFFIFA